MRFYWTTTCCLCDHQGQLFVMKYLHDQQLYLHCGECEWGWREPCRVDDKDRAFLTLVDPSEAIPATWQDIARAGWVPFVSGLIETEQESTTCGELRNAEVFRDTAGAH